MLQDPMELLERFAAREGHALVPKAHVEDGFALGKWVTKRRFAYQQGRVDLERSSRLEQLPGWSWTPRADRWEETYNHPAVRRARRSRLRPPGRDRKRHTARSLGLGTTAGVQAGTASAGASLSTRRPAWVGVGWPGGSLGAPLCQARDAGMKPHQAIRVPVVPDSSGEKASDTVGTLPSANCLVVPYASRRCPPLARRASGGQMTGLSPATRARLNEGSGAPSYNCCSQLQDIGDEWTGRDSVVVRC